MARLLDQSISKTAGQVITWMAGHMSITYLGDAWHKESSKLAEAV